MKKKGFTLPEILGVIVIIGLLLIIVGPGVLNRIRGSRDTSVTAVNKIIFDATGQHINDDKGSYPNGNRYCVSIEKLIEEGKLVSPVIDVTTGKTVDKDYSVLVTIYENGVIDYELIKDGECRNNEQLPLIEFESTPDFTVWSTKKRIKIIYPDGENKEYRKDNGNWTPYTKEIEYTKEGEIEARVRYNDNIITRKMHVGNIDTTKPNIKVQKPTKCSDILKPKAIFTDEGGSRLYGYAVSEAGNADIANNLSGKKQEITLNLELNKTYKIDAKDNAGNTRQVSYTVTDKGTLTLDANGGKFSDGKAKYTKEIRCNNPYGDLPTPTRAGYTFVGWYSKKDSNYPLEYYRDLHTDLKTNYFEKKIYPRTLIEVQDHYIRYGIKEKRRISEYISTDINQIGGDQTLYAGWIDTTPPTKPSITKPTTGKWVDGWTNAAFSLTLKSKDNESGLAYYQYTYSNAASATGTNNTTHWVTYANSAKEEFVTTAFEANRNNDVYVRACDKAGNCSAKNSTRIKLDTKGPTIKNIKHTAPSNKVTFSCDDSGGIGATKASDSKSASGNKTQTLILSCKDKLGNESTSKKTLTYSSCATGNSREAYQDTCYGTYKYDGTCTKSEEYYCTRCKSGFSVRTCKEMEGGYMQNNKCCIPNQTCTRQVSYNCKKTATGYYSCTKYKNTCKAGYKS